MVALAAAALVQVQAQQRDSGHAGIGAGHMSAIELAKKPDINVINVGTAVEGNSAPFGWTDVAHYRQYYGPGAFGSEKQLKIQAIAFSSHAPSGSGPLMVNVTITLGLAHTLVPPQAYIPLEDAKVCFNGRVETILDGNPEDLRFPCMKDYHYRPDKGDVLVLDVVVHQQSSQWVRGFWFGYSPDITRQYANSWSPEIAVYPGQGLYTTFEVK
jgi:hypothetical protein